MTQATMSRMEYDMLTEEEIRDSIKVANEVIFIIESQIEELRKKRDESGTTEEDYDRLETLIFRLKQQLDYSRNNLDKLNKELRKRVEEQEGS